MAVTYEITSTAVFGRAVVAYEKRKRRDAAHDALYGAVYEMLKANALLDTALGHRLAKEARDAEVSPPPRGHYRVQKFRLPEPYGQSVELFVTRN